MRIPSGKTDQLIFFVAVDSVDLNTRKTGLSSFTVYRSRNGAAPVVYITPTVTELSSTNMPGTYALTVDEDTTVGASSDSEEYCVHVTQASMAPVTRVVELYRRAVTSGQTLTVTSGGASLSAAAIQGIWDALSAALTTANSIGKKLADWAIGTTQTGDSFARLGTPAGASHSADIAAVKAETAAIKPKTDSLTFTIAGQADANIQSVNDVLITGTGITGSDEWRPS